MHLIQNQILAMALFRLLHLFYHHYNLIHPVKTQLIIKPFAIIHLIKINIKILNLFAFDEIYKSNFLIRLRY